MTPDRAPRGILSPRRTAAVRGLAFLALWLVLLPSMKPGDLLIGLLSAAAATLVSMKLLPPATGSLNIDALVMLAPHFLWESVKAGIDVARRALAPRPRLAPGFVSCPLDFPPGLARNTFATITSMMPGTVPSGEDNATLVYHCLDTAEPVVEQLWKEEALLSRALVAGRRHD
jgi:multicomponent Na+:H+ antiporter subunit E